MRVQEMTSLLQKEMILEGKGEQYPLSINPVSLFSTKK